MRAFNLIRGIFASAPALASLIESETVDTLLSNAVDISVGLRAFARSGTRRRSRSSRTRSVFGSAEQARNPDSEILAAARPALATLGGPLICVSSPYAKRGELCNGYKRDYGPDGDPKIIVINAPSRRTKPLLSATVVQRAYERDPQAAASEFGGQFRNDISGFLDFVLIDATADRGVLVRPPRAGVDYRSACDPSGGAHDSFTPAVAHDEGEVAVLDCLVEVKPPFTPTSAVADMAATLVSYGLSTTVGDKYAAGWVVDAFAKVGVTYEHAERDRSEAYLDALPLFTSGRWCQGNGGSSTCSATAISRAAIYATRVRHSAKAAERLCL